MSAMSARAGIPVIDDVIGSDVVYQTWKLPQPPSMDRSEAVCNDLKHKKSS